MAKTQWEKGPILGRKRASAGGVRLDRIRSVLKRQSPAIKSRQLYGWQPDSLHLEPAWSQEYPLHYPPLLAVSPLHYLAVAGDYRGLVPEGVWRDVDRVLWAFWSKLELLEQPKLCRNDRVGSLSCCHSLGQAIALDTSWSS